MWKLLGRKKHCLFADLNGKKEWEEAPDYFSLDLKQSESIVVLISGDAWILA